MACKVDNTAIEKCREDFNALMEVIDASRTETERRTREIRIWEIQHAAWVRNHAEQSRRRDAGRKITHLKGIFYEGKEYDCANLKGDVP
jgi:hypothetical protein|tara:strand:- start:46 stop:312 length:267 start_codon:yes stop_codon:yes gene_type:complete